LGNPRAGSSPVSCIIFLFFCRVQEWLHPAFFFTAIRFHCMGAVGMTQEWVLNDNITSAETVVQMMFHSMPGNMRSILF
jgi:hypothetical protein